MSSPGGSWPRSKGASIQVTRSLPAERFVRPVNTVQSHVSTVLTILDVPSRAAVSTALAEHEGAVGRGGIPRRDPYAVLTPAQRRVAELAALGRSNRSIGLSLGLSARTVEKHLRKALDRADAPSRAALARAFGPPPWVPPEA